mgnify:CR=1 FL=1
MTAKKEETEDYAAVLKQQIEDCIADVEKNPDMKRIYRQIGVKASLRRCLESKARYLAQEELKDDRIVALCLSCVQDQHGCEREDWLDLPEITRYALAEMGWPLRGLEEVAWGNEELSMFILKPGFDPSGRKVEKKFQPGGVWVHPKILTNYANYGVPREERHEFKKWGYAAGDTLPRTGYRGNYNNYN